MFHAFKIQKNYQGVTEWRKMTLQPFRINDTLQAYIQNTLGLRTLGKLNKKGAKKAEKNVRYKRNENGKKTKIKAESQSEQYSYIMQNYDHNSTKIQANMQPQCILNTVQTRSKYGQNTLRIQQPKEKNCCDFHPNEYTIQPNKAHPN